MTAQQIYNRFKEENPELEAYCGHEVMAAYELMRDTYRRVGKVLACGNGGSASDSEHIVGELMKGFLLRRPIPQRDADALEEMFGEEGVQLSKGLQGALPAISLTGHPALSTAFLNDVDPYNVFAQQVYGYGAEGDTLIALSTSGNSKNVVKAVQVGKLKGVRAIAITGAKESRLSELCEVTVKTPTTETYLVQQDTLIIYHALCAMLEAEFFEM